MPEFIQDQVTADQITPAMSQLLASPDAREDLSRRFAELHYQLRQDANHRAAEAALGLIQPRIGQ